MGGSLSMGALAMGVGVGEHARDGQSLAPLRHMTTDDVTQVSNPKIKFENEKK